MGTVSTQYQPAPYRSATILEILRIKWSDFVSNEEVLQRSGAEDIEMIVIKSRLRWLGHVARMNGDHPVKSLIYGELFNGSRSVGLQS